jgi:hypothetical protein
LSRWEDLQVLALLRGQPTEGLNGRVGNLVFLQNAAIVLDDIRRKVRQLHQGVVVWPKTLHEELVELDDGLECFAGDFLDAGSASSKHLELLAYVADALDHLRRQL